MTLDEAKTLISNVRATFESPQGKEVMNYLELIGSWTPHINDSLETNAIVARDANRRLIGTLKTLLTASPEQICALANREE